MRYLTDLNGLVTGIYDYDGSLVTGVTWSGPVTGSVTASYDNFFRVNALSVNGANPVGFSYDDDGLLVQAGDLILARDPLNGRLTAQHSVT